MTLVVKQANGSEAVVDVTAGRSDSACGWHARAPAGKIQKSTLVEGVSYTKGVAGTHDEPFGWIVGVTLILYEPGATLMNRTQRKILLLPNVSSSTKSSGLVPVVHTAQGASGLGVACVAVKLSRLAGLRPLTVLPPS